MGEIVFGYLVVCYDDGVAAQLVVVGEKYGFYLFLFYDGGYVYVGEYGYLLLFCCLLRERFVVLVLGGVGYECYGGAVCMGERCDY